MATTRQPEATVGAVGETLLNYAVQREDLKGLVAGLPVEAAVDPVAMEYEIQILKIVSVGWGISYFMGERPEKAALAEAYWGEVRDFSGRISAITTETSGREIDYFQALRERVDIYVNALNHFSDVDDPGPVIGHTFAKLCGDEEDMYTMVSGKRVFHLSLAGVKSYLESVRITPEP